MAYTEIDKSSDYFNTVLYTGNDTDNRTVSGVGFQPNFLWIKARNNADQHYLVDSVRGSTKVLHSDSTEAEATRVSAVKSFASDGFVLGQEAQVNGNNNTYVSWNWKAGTSVSGNTGGSGTSKSYSGSVNTDSGFSIIKYIGNSTAGHTIPHHLGVQPQVVICKRINQGGQWVFGSMALPNQFEQFLELDLTGAAQTSSLRWNDTDPSSSVFTLGSTLDTNANDINIIAYSFAEKKGFSKFGSYTGNGSTDGPFVYTGFKPAFVICKSYSGSEQWVLYDNKRDPFNVTEQILRPNLSDAEGTESGAKMDLLSNGFKLTGSGGGIGQTNNSGSSYIYMAFAENPFVSSTGIPGLAR